MTKKTEVKQDPALDEQVTDQPEDGPAVCRQPIEPGPAVGIDLTQIDLTHVVNGLWPGNPPNRSGNFYFDLNRLEMESGQSGLLGNLCENFVFERVDVHMIRPSDTDFSLSIMLNDERFMGSFDIDGDTLKTQRMDPETHNKVQAGTFLGKEKIYLKLHCDTTPVQGRVVVNFIGYLIEPWR